MSHFIPCGIIYSVDQEIAGITWCIRNNQQIIAQLMFVVHDISINLTETILKTHFAFDLYQTFGFGINWK